MVNEKNVCCEYSIFADFLISSALALLIHFLIDSKNRKNDAAYSVINRLVLFISLYKNL
jgi:hypothetical protein